MFLRYAQLLLFLFDDHGYHLTVFPKTAILLFLMIMKQMIYFSREKLI